MTAILDPIVVTNTRLHYVLVWEGRECASVEIVTSEGQMPEVVVTVTPDDDDVRSIFRVIPN